MTDIFQLVSLTSAGGGALFLAIYYLVGVKAEKRIVEEKETLAAAADVKRQEAELQRGDRDSIGSLSARTTSPSHLRKQDSFFQAIEQAHQEMSGHL